MATKNYAAAKECYAALGVDTDKAIDCLKQIPISLHCWQGDDIIGFENSNSSLGSGIAVTGNYPGRARNMEELRSDILKAMSLTPGKYRLNLHANYADFSSAPKVDRDALRPEHFQSWIDWGKEHNIALDFNSTFFSHPKADGLTLTNKDKGIRDFWIEHAKRCREIGEAMGKAQGSACVHNIWIADGMKDLPADRNVYREILKNSLDDILSKKISKDYLLDAVESKVFGIGTESYVVGSNEFYLGYAIKNDILLTLDLGHFHPTENVADKIGTALMYVPGILFHLSRGVRWDSDHVILYNDELRMVGEEIIRTNQLDKIHIGTDYFDASINRIGAWATGSRAAQKSLLHGLLLPNAKLREYEDKGNYGARLALLEAAKTLPFADVWNEYCEQCNAPTDLGVIDEVAKYEAEVTSKR